MTNITAHKNVKVFITHAGTHGTLEAIHEAKPMVMLPLYGDQLSTAAILEELGVGVRLDTGKLTREQLLNATDTILNDDRLE